MESISRWAYLHHEKLDGSGYPFGLKAENLGREERLLACLDIYQALREERPYKPGMTHTDAMAVLSGMAAGGQLDAGIVGDIHQCFKDEAA
jgi:HD-GYP domain-containing protein (c-di-GMP phosphodiesterase class II)